MRRDVTSFKSNNMWKTETTMKRWKMMRKKKKSLYGKMLFKKYEVQAHQKRNEAQTERQPILTMITMLQKRLDELLIEESLHNLEHPEECPQPD